MAGARRKHKLVSSNVTISLGTQLRDSPCEVYSNDMKVRADQSRQYSYPDVVVVEVLSPSTEAKDRGEKFLRWRHIETLTNYLLIAQNERRIEQFTKQSDGLWLLTETADSGEVRLESIGCLLSLTDVYNKVKTEPALRLVSEEPR